MRRVLRLLCLGMAAVAAVAAAEERDVAWSSVSGAGCERIVATTNEASTGLGLKVPAGPLASCAITSMAPRALAGRRVLLAASFRAAVGDTPDVVLMLTQFRGGKVSSHDFVTRTIAASGDASLELRSAVLPDSESITVAVQVVHAATAVDVTNVVLTAGDALDADMSRDARAYLDTALAIVAEKSIALDPARRDALMRDARFLASGAVGTADTYDAIRFVLARIGDGHSRFILPETATAWNALLPKPPYGIERASFGRIGYLRLPGFQSLDARERSRYARFLGWSVQAAVEGDRTAEGIDGLVIDLRANDGGSWVAMRDGLCSLFPPGLVLGAFEFRGGRRYDWTCPRSAPAVAMVNHRSSTIPVAVLIGPHTASAGEMVAIALAARDRTVSIGSGTGGFTTGIEVVPLRDGALLALATSVSVGRDGKGYPHGIAPDIVLTGGGDASSDPSDVAMVAAREWTSTNRQVADVDPRSVPAHSGGRVDRRHSHRPSRADHG